MVNYGKSGHNDLKKGRLARIRVTTLTTTATITPEIKGVLGWLITPRLLKILSKT
jgi:hypothetical protein